MFEYIDVGEPPTGRYFIRLSNGRTFCIEPLHERDQKVTDVAWRNGGISGDAMKHKSVVQGGSTLESESIITEANGYKNIQVVANPMDVIERAMREDGLL